MRLTILGSGTAIISKKRKSSAYLLELNNNILLFDCGNGAIENLMDTGIQPKDIDHIFITHPHADHMGSLINLLQSMFVAGLYFPKLKRSKSLNIHGYKGFINDYTFLRKIMFPEREEPYQINIHEYPDEIKKFEDLTIQSEMVHHVPEHFSSVGFRVQSKNEDKTFTYSGDSGYSESLVRLSQNADIALLEAAVSISDYAKKGPHPNHLSPWECGFIAEKSNVQHLILTHLYDLDKPSSIGKEIRQNFSGKYSIAHDLDIIEA